MDESRQPITAELRRSGEHRKAGGDYAPMREFVIEADRFGELCDQIDVICASLESENATLKKSAEHAYDNGFDAGFASAYAEHGWVRKDKARVIGNASIEVTMHIDYARMANELRDFAEMVQSYGERVAEADR